MERRRVFPAAGVAALAVAAAVLCPPRAEAGNENHPYGVLPYGFNYPTDAHI